MQTAVDPSLLEELTRLARSVKPDGTAADVTRGLHRLWRTVCGHAFGGSIDRLEALAAAAPEACATAGIGVLASRLGHLVQGMALLRACHYREGAAALAAATQDRPGETASDATAVVTAFAHVWQAIGKAASGMPREMRGHLGAADRSLHGVAHVPALQGLLGLGKALQEYHLGLAQRGLEILDGVSRSFLSPDGGGWVEYDGFEAEAKLLRAKLLREMSQYGPAMQAIRDSQIHRLPISDTLGQIRGCIESARVHRFQGKPDEAKSDLTEAEVRLRDTGFDDWQCRVQDQLGDIWRARHDFAAAARCYKEAGLLAERPQCENRLLGAHVANSMARLYEEQGDADRALVVLRDVESTWRGTEAYGKFLYLRGTVRMRQGDTFGAKLDLDAALRLFEEGHLLSHIALVHNRLAMNCAQTARVKVALHKNSDAKDLTREACAHWAEALRRGTQVDAKRFMARLREDAVDLTTTDLLDVVGALRDEVSALRGVAEQNRERMARAADHRQRERYFLSHYYVRNANHWLRSKGRRESGVRAALEAFGQILDGALWWSQDFGDRPAPRDQIVVAAEAPGWEAGVRKLCGGVVEFEVSHAEGVIHANRDFLRTGVVQLVAGLAAALKPTSIRLAVADGPESTRLAFHLTGATTQDFEDEAKCLLSGQAGRGGRLLVACFVIEVTLWGSIRPSADDTIYVDLPKEVPDHGR